MFFFYCDFSWVPRVFPFPVYFALLWVWFQIPRTLLINENEKHDLSSRGARTRFPARGTGSRESPTSVPESLFFPSRLSLLHGTGRDEERPWERYDIIVGTGSWTRTAWGGVWSFKMTSLHNYYTTHSAKTAYLTKSTLGEKWSFLCRCLCSVMPLNVLHTVEAALTIRIMFSPKALIKAHEKTNQQTCCLHSRACFLPS